MQRAAVSCAAALLVALAAGCQPQSARGTAEAPAVQIEQSRPEDAARSILRVLNEQRALIAREERTAADALRERALRELVARERLEEVLARVMRPVGGKKATDAETTEAVQRAVDGWGSLVGYYLDTAKVDQAALEISNDPNVARVLIPTGRAEMTTPIRVSCVLGGDQKWRVVGVEFATNTTLHVPTSRPTTAPAATSRSSPAAP